MNETLALIYDGNDNQRVKETRNFIAVVSIRFSSLVNAELSYIAYLQATLNDTLIRMS